MGSPLAMSPPSVLTGIGPSISVAPSAMSFSCSPSAQKPFSAMWMTSAPASVSCSWIDVDVLGADPGLLVRGPRRVDGGGDVLLDRRPGSWTTS